MQKEKKDIAQMTLFEKLAAIREMIGILKKDKSGYNYKYVDESTVLSHITAGLERYNIDYFPEFIPGTTLHEVVHLTKTKMNKDKQLYEEHSDETVVRADICVRWINLDNPTDTYVVPWLVIGQQSDASQALGSGLTYCLRYFLLKFFKAATTDDDPDKIRKLKAEAVNQLTKEEVAGVVIQIDALCTERMTDQNREDVVKICRKYIRANGKPSANYFEIKDATVADTVLQELTKLFDAASKTTKKDTIVNITLYLSRNV